MNQIKVKTFIKALEVVAKVPSKYQQYLSDKRMTQAEKTILESLMLLRDNKTQEISNNLANLVTTEPLVESMRQLFLGIAFNNSGLTNDAIQALEKSLALMQEFELPYYEFLASYNLYIACLNAKHTEKTKQALEQFLRLKPEGNFGEICHLRSEFSYFAFIGNYENAEMKLDELEKRFDTLGPAHTVSYIVEKFCYFIKVDRLTDAASAF